jgi:hypothetical protein
MSSKEDNNTGKTPNAFGENNDYCKICWINKHRKDLEFYQKLREK